MKIKNLKYYDKILTLMALDAAFEEHEGIRYIDQKWFNEKLKEMGLVNLNKMSDEERSELRIIISDRLKKIMDNLKQEIG